MCLLFWHPSEVSAAVWSLGRVSWLLSGKRLNSWKSLIDSAMGSPLQVAGWDWHFSLWAYGSCLALFHRWKLWQSDFCNGFFGRLGNHHCWGRGCCFRRFAGHSSDDPSSWDHCSSICHSLGLPTRGYAALVGKQSDGCDAPANFALTFGSCCWLRTCGLVVPDWGSFGGLCSHCFGPQNCQSFDRIWQCFAMWRLCNLLE